MNKRDFLIIIVGLSALGIIILASFFFGSEPEKARSVNVITSQDNYNKGDMLKIKIENNLEEKICFSSCYPYYFEREDGTWLNYNYTECTGEDLGKYCIEAENVKAFELLIPSLMEGIHRITLSACVGCNPNELFQEEEKFYSNDFIIK